MATPLNEMPGLPGLYGRALLQWLRAARLLPGARSSSTDAVSPIDEASSAAVSVRGVTLSEARLARYCSVCGFDADVGAPATYPHVLALPLHLMLMTGPTSPLQVVGLVHVANSIVQERRLAATDAIDLSAFMTAPRPHPRGRQVTVVTQARVADEVVWRGESVFLSRTRGPEGSFAARRDDASSGVDDAAMDAAEIGPRLWRLPAQVGRRYASVSGDRNPIHLYDVTAKPFGFQRHIAHGMWTKARALAELTDRLPERFRIDVAFRRPLTLPSTVRFGARDDTLRIDFDVTGVPSGQSGSSATTHLVGTATRL